MKSPILLFFFLCIISSVIAQNDEATPTDFGFEMQAYPTGLIPGIYFEKTLGERHAIHLRLGYNWIRHRDLGVHEDERGDGWGFTLGYKRYFNQNFTGFFSTAKVDIWSNNLDWKDNIDTPIEIRGNTSITVLQPTLEIGYLFLLSKNNLTISPTVAFGYEVNVKTKGEPVGEGAILLLGIQLGKRF